MQHDLHSAQHECDVIELALRRNVIEREADTAVCNDVCATNPCAHVCVT